MTVPTADGEFLNLNTVIFTDQGDPIAINDLFAKLAGTRLDGIDDYKTSSETPSVVGDDEITVGFWMRSTATTGGFAASQRANTLGVGDGAWDIVISSGIVSLAMRDGNNTGIGDSVSIDDPDVNDGTWRFMMFAGSVASGVVDIDIYKDGSEMTYTQQDRKTGTITQMGSSGTMGPLTVGALDPAGTSPYECDLSRIKVWRVKLSGAQALEEYNNELALIPFPITTFEDTDFSNGSIWNLVNGATTSTDVFNSVQANGININSRVEHLGANPIANGSGDKHSISCWFTTNNTGTQIIMAQRDKGGSPTASVWDIEMVATGDLICNFFSALNASSGIQSVATGNFKSTNTPRHLLFTVDGNDLNIYINGVEATYTSQDTINGGGFTGVAAGGGDALTVLGFSTNGFGLPGTCTRPKFWQGITLTSAEALEEYQNERALLANPTFFSNDVSTGWTLSGGVTFVDDPVDGIAGNFDGINDRASNSGPGPAKIIDNTWRAWVKTTDTDSFPFTQGSISVGGSLWHLKVNSSTNALVLAQGNNTNTIRTQINFNPTTNSSGINMLDGEWHMITVVMSFKDLEIYLDGKLVSTTPSQTGGGIVVPNPSGTGSMTLAWISGSNDDHMQGQAGHVAAWMGFELTAEEILADFVAQTAIDPDSDFGRRLIICYGSLVGA